MLKTLHVINKERKMAFTCRRAFPKCPALYWISHRHLSFCKRPYNFPKPSCPL